MHFLHQKCYAKACMISCTLCYNNYSSNIMTNEEEQELWVIRNDESSPREDSDEQFNN